MEKEGLSTRGMIYASMFGAATAAGAYIMIPLPPVPITLQTFFVYLAGGLLGARLGALSQFIYLILGAIGLPVFHGGKGGFGVLFGPTGGYLVGFVVAPFVIGSLMTAKLRSGVVWTALSMIGGTAVIYLLGVAQLWAVARLTLTKSILVGMLPFLPGDALKIAVATAVTLKLREKLRVKGIFR